MLNFLIYYAIFAVTTGITGYFSIYRPILVLMKEEHGEVHPILEYPKLAALVLILISTISAPFILRTVLFGPDDNLIEELMSKFIEDDEI